MKTLPFRILKSGKESIKVEHDTSDYFYDTLHNHEEFQITLVIKGSGTAYIGDTIQPFEEGEIYLMGGNLPHAFRSDDSCYSDTSTGSEAISIFFKEDFMGSEFLSLPECIPIRTLLDKSARGLKISGFLNQVITKLIIDINSSFGLKRLLVLMQILGEISHSKEIRMLAGVGFHKPRSEADSNKINDVFDFVMSNFQRPMKLEEAASVANMSPPAFCRYFKQHTRKTYSRFLNEIRIGQACRLLLEGKLNITGVCYHSGFNNISNFNRQFKVVTGYTPSQYLSRVVN